MPALLFPSSFPRWRRWLAACDRRSKPGCQDCCYPLARRLAAAAGFLACAFAVARAQGADPSLLPESSLNAPYGSAMVPLDSWQYPAMERLMALGYGEGGYLGMRPWTRDTFVRMLHAAGEQLESRSSSDVREETAQDLYAALARSFGDEIAKADAGGSPAYAKLDRVYGRVEEIAGQPLRDSYHVGQTIVDDDGRPFGQGLNSYEGFLAHTGRGRFTLQVRGEYQHAPGVGAYSPAALEAFSVADELPLAPGAGAMRQTNVFRLIEANASMRLVGHEISVGKSEDWWGPGQGGAMAWSNNAEPVYGLRINRVVPLRIPLLSRLTGPFRYEGVFGSLKGQSFPRNPWVHAQKFSFQPTPNLEFGFSRVVVFAGEGHVPLTFGSFWHSFAGFSNVSLAEKDSRLDPGARHSSFDFLYRLPFLRNWATLYTDSIVHDDTSPIDAPRHAAVRPGVYLSHIPGAPRMDLRVEAASTDPATGRSNGGKYVYWEGQYRNAYTNKGDIFGDWIGREGKGGQAWLTWWLDPRQSVQLEYRRAKAAKDFIAGGTTQSDFALRTVLRLRKDVELRAYVQGELWSAPVVATGARKDVTAGAQVTVFGGQGMRRLVLGR